MTHHFQIAIHFEFHERTFEVSEVIICRDCRKAYPVGKYLMSEGKSFSGARVRPDNDWNMHTLAFDVGKFLNDHPDFHALLHEECAVFDEIEMASARGHGT